MNSRWVPVGFPPRSPCTTVRSLMCLVSGFTMITIRSLVRCLMRFLMWSSWVPRCFPWALVLVFSHVPRIIRSSFPRAICTFHCIPRVHVRCAFPVPFFVFPRLISALTRTFYMLSSFPVFSISQLCPNPNPDWHLTLGRHQPHVFFYRFPVVFLLCSPYICFLGFLAYFIAIDCQHSSGNQAYIKIEQHYTTTKYNHVFVSIKKISSG